LINNLRINFPVAIHIPFGNGFLFKGTQASTPARDNFLKALPATAEGCVPIAIRIPFGNGFFCVFQQN
jgi:hypothetical protein